MNYLEKSARCRAEAKRWESRKKRGVAAAAREKRRHRVLLTMNMPNGPLVITLRSIARGGEHRSMWKQKVIPHFAEKHQDWPFENLLEADREWP